MNNHVPDWVHMVDVPPPLTDEEPWYCCGDPVRHMHDLRSGRVVMSDRRRSGTLAAACFIGCLVLVVAWAVSRG